jgi:hypothetical protein
VTTSSADWTSFAALSITHNPNSDVLSISLACFVVNKIYKKYIILENFQIWKNLHKRVSFNTMIMFLPFGHHKGIDLLLKLLEQRRGSVGRRRQKQQQGRGINIALCTLKGSSIPEQGEEFSSAHCQRRQQPTDHKKGGNFFPKWKIVKVTLARLNSPWEMVGSRGRRLKIAEQGHVSGKKLQQPTAMRQ